MSTQANVKCFVARLCSATTPCICSEAVFRTRSSVSKKWWHCLAVVARLCSATTPCICLEAVFRTRSSVSKKWWHCLAVVARLCSATTPCICLEAGFRTRSYVSKKWWHCMAVAWKRFHICFCAAAVSKALGRETSVLAEHERASGIASVRGHDSGDGHEVGHSRTSCPNIPGSVGTPSHQGRGKAFESKNRVRMLLTGSCARFLTGLFPWMDQRRSNDLWIPTARTMPRTSALWMCTRWSRIRWSLLPAGIWRWWCLVCKCCFEIGATVMCLRCFFSACL